MHKLSLIFALATTLSSCTAARMACFNRPTIHDSRLFVNAVLPTSDTAQNPPQRATFYACPTIDSLFDDGNTLGIVVLRGDSIIYSHFEGDLSLHTPTDLFSLSKSFVGALTGIAIEQGYIRSIDDSIARYLPHCASFLGDSARICDLLNMRLGMFEPHLHTARLYYTPNLAQTASRLHHNRPHGEYNYASNATQLLAHIIEQATGLSFEEYFIDNYWIPCAASHEGFWSIDSRRHHNIRAFCGLCITPIDLLKLGIIYRDNGALFGRQIMPAEWVEHTLNPPYHTNDRGPATYHCQWYIINPDHEFLGQGLMGQILYVNKITDTVVARFGTARGKTDWTAELGRIAALPNSYFP